MLVVHLFGWRGAELEFTLWCVDKSVSSTLEGRGTSAAAAKSCTRDALGDGPGGGSGDGVTLRGLGPGLRRAVTNIHIVIYGPVFMNRFP